MSDVEVIVYKNGKEIDRVRRPLRTSSQGLAVTYRRQLWPLRNGTVNLDEDPVSAGPERHPVVQPAASPIGPDPAQENIIHRPASDRLLVDAGPGTGKTHVACARVVALIGQDIPASRVWLISFTRTAVREIRNRIAATLSDPADAAAVCIATLDSHAWSLQSGFNVEARIRGSFDENIEETVRRLQEDSELREYLATRVRHVLIDEGQDIVGIRAELTMALIQAIAEDCGVTVFADEAQAIYGFSEDSELQSQEGPTFIDQLRTAGFEEVSLRTIYRTARPGLRTICNEIRKKVLRRTGSPALRRSRIETEIRSNADASDGSLTEMRLPQIPEDALVLARRRVDVLQYSSRQAEVPHRLRMSGLPPCLKPWIAHLLWDWTEPLLTRTQFGRLWSERHAAALPASPEAEEAWRLLVEVAGKSAVAITLHRLREVLGRATPPILFCTPEFGAHGPIIGTIHASKGREADTVALFLPQIVEDDADTQPTAKMEEEIRVMFVGATRARQHLRIGHTNTVGASSVNGRVWRRIRPDRGRQRIQVEVGGRGDVTPEGLVGRRCFPDPKAAQAAQLIWTNTPVRRDLLARAVRELDWDFVLETSAGTRVGLLGPQLKSDLRQISRDSHLWPQVSFIPHLRSLGARTLVIPPDDSRVEQLHEPWRTSGFLSAPLLIGFSSCYLGESK